MNPYMSEAKLCADSGIADKQGGPFGAVIVDENGKIIARGNNRVIIDNDPTAHAEVIAIRNACKALSTYDLSGKILYTSCEPCPMCLSAVIWANIKEIYYGCSRHDADKIGFRDNDIYNYLKGENTGLVTLTQLDHEDCIKTFEKYMRNKGKMY